MTIDCSARWAGSDGGGGGEDEGSRPTLAGVRMAYELVVDVGDWLVSGRKKGSFAVEVRPPPR